MYINKGMTILEGIDLAMDYCKKHKVRHTGPECHKCEREAVQAIAESEKSEQRPKAWQ